MNAENPFKHLKEEQGKIENSRQQSEEQLKEKQKTRLRELKNEIDSVVMKVLTQIRDIYFAGFGIIYEEVNGSAHWMIGRTTHDRLDRAYNESRIYVTAQVSDSENSVPHFVCGIRQHGYYDKPHIQECGLSETELTNTFIELLKQFPPR